VHAFKEGLGYGSATQGEEMSAIFQSTSEKAEKQNQRKEKEKRRRKTHNLRL
jgi:hypothetical protein